MLGVRSTRRGPQGGAGAGPLAWACVALLGGARVAVAQQPVAYTLTVDRADTTVVRVSMRIPDARPATRVALYAHPESDDRYWRYVDALTATQGGQSVPVVREDSAAWRIAARPGALTLAYTVRVAPLTGRFRQAWRPSLGANGGLVGGADMFLYVVGPSRQATVQLRLPAAWRVATGLPRAAAPLQFRAPTTRALVDSPLLVGALASWTIRTGVARVRIVFQGDAAGAPFDTGAFVAATDRVARATVALVGAAPPRDYVFLFRDGRDGALEHVNSVVIGVRSANLSANPSWIAGSVAHEFLHTWNGIAVHPRGFWDIGFTAPPPVPSLWFSEGVTMYYADALLRAAHVPTDEPSRVAHLEARLGDYFTFSDNARYSADAVSRASNVVPNPLGSTQLSTHLQGELLGMVLDLVLRDRSDGARSLDDLLRRMLRTHAEPRGFVPTDLEAAASAVCRCDLRPLFARYVSGAGVIDFNRYLAPVGYRVELDSLAEGATWRVRARFVEAASVSARARRLRAAWLALE
jgi:predicted metalloprotease with PDZ domain